MMGWWKPLGGLCLLLIQPASSTHSAIHLFLYSRRIKWFLFKISIWLSICLWNSFSITDIWNLRCSLILFKYRYFYYFIFVPVIKQILRLHNNSSVCSIRLGWNRVNHVFAPSASRGQERATVGPEEEMDVCSIVLFASFLKIKFIFKWSKDEYFNDKRYNSQRR